MENRRTVKSFVQRARPLGANKQEIFNGLWPKYGIDITSGFITPKEIFGNSNSITLEIGFGNGETLFSLANKHREQNFIGIEVYKPGIASILSQLKKIPLDNLKIYNDDAVMVLNNCIPNLSLDQVLILFPDPWPKKRHHKRRLIQPVFIEKLLNKIKIGGILNIATDWGNYAQHIEKVLKNNLSLIQKDSASSKRSLITKFEERGKKLGHKNFEFLFTKK